MKICPNCGNSLDDSIKFCNGCGTKQPEPAMTHQANRNTGTVGMAPRGFSTVTPISIFAVLAMICAICGFLISAFCYCIPSILGLVFAAMACAQCKTGKGGYKLAIAAVIISAVSIVLCIVFKIVLHNLESMLTSYMYSSLGSLFY